jgi:hypothetical protein
LRPQIIPATEGGLGVTLCQGFVGLWSVEELKNNQLRIEAGPALEAFLEHVFAYWASRQAQFFGEKKGEWNDL